MAEYMILSKEPDHGNIWRDLGYVQGSSAEAAVRHHVASGGKGGVFLAIPERSAKTIRVKVETVQKVSVDAGEDNG